MLTQFQTSYTQAEHTQQNGAGNRQHSVYTAAICTEALGEPAIARVQLNNTAAPRLRRAEDRGHAADVPVECVVHIRDEDYIPQAARERSATVLPDPCTADGAGKGITIHVRKSERPGPLGGSSRDIGDRHGDQEGL